MAAAQQLPEHVVVRRLPGAGGEEHHAVPFPDRVERDGKKLDSVTFETVVGQFSLNLEHPMSSRRAFEIAFVGLKPGMHEYRYEIDDAFFDSFLMVNPTGTPMNETLRRRR